MRVIETEYKGYRFRSRLEARWAVFFDACGVRWEYEPEGYVLHNGQCYLPDFLLHDVAGRGGGELHVEAKGKMTRADAAKINQFSEGKHPLLVVAGIPDGDTIDDIDEYLSDWGYGGFPHFGGGPYPFNFETIDGDYFVAHPGINLDGQFELFGDDGSYLCDRNPVATLEAYRIARQARFEYGQTPRVRKVSV